MFPGDDSSDQVLPKILFFGNNSDGQAGIAYSEENACSAVEVKGPSVDIKRVSRIVVSQKQTFVCGTDGSILSAGENDNNELGRPGKRSLFNRIDALETFQLIDLAVGDGFVILGNRDGRGIAWGRNDMGQLGIGNRETREKPKLHSILRDGILQVSCGLQHAVALSRRGDIYCWGANKKGQLGDGQLTSSCTPLLLTQLRHRPVVSIACGEGHTIVLTVGGNAYSWGDNTCGQLGTGDTTHRLRPELMRHLRAAKIRQISAGKQHSAIISPSGLLFTFGSNSHGQCGAANGAEMRVQPMPTVVERLREMISIEVSCGNSHTLILCTLEGRKRLYGMGLNSQGQLGLGHRNTVFTPSRILFGNETEDSRIIGLASGPLAFHSFVITEGVPLARPVLPAVDMIALRLAASKLTSLAPPDKQTHVSAEALKRCKLEEDMALQHLRELVAAAYSSISVLNASFQLSGIATVPSSSKSFTDGGACKLHLPAVREAYELIFRTGSESLIATLGRATLQMSEKLIECPFDDPENLSVFLIVFENPLMLQSSFFYIAIERVLRGVLALPKALRVTLFGWLKSYPSEYFSRVIQVCQNYLSYSLSADGRKANVDSSVVVLTLNSLFDCNLESKIIPESFFYNAHLPKAVNLLTEWQKRVSQAQGCKVFNFCDYTFLLDVNIKNTLLHASFHEKKIRTMNQMFLKYLNATTADNGNSSQTRVPDFIKIEGSSSGSSMPRVALRMSVSRSRLVEDVIQCLDEVLRLERDALSLPLIVEFEDEQGLDHGGVSKELFTLVISALLSDRRIVSPCGADGKATHLWFVKSDNKSNSGGTRLCRGAKNGWAPSGSCSTCIPDRYLEAAPFYLGLLVGLACYNNVFVDVPLPASLYKSMKNIQLTLADLFEVDAGLAKGLKNLLQYDESTTHMCIEEAFSATFTASVNPLVDSHLMAMEESSTAMDVDLVHIPNSSDQETVDSLKSQGSLNSSMAEKRPQLKDPLSVSTENMFHPDYCELKADGENIDVTRRNRAEFVDLFVNHALYGSCESSAQAYIAGVRALVSGLVVDICSHTEMETLVRGLQDIPDLSDLRLNTSYRGEFTDEHPTINLFWDTLADLPTYEKRKFVQFVTGSDRVPVGGLSQLRLVVQSTRQPSTSLPVAHTCFNTLDLPATYESKETLRERLLLALEHCVGFGLV